MTRTLAQIQTDLEALTQELTDALAKEAAGQVRFLGTTPPDKAVIVDGESTYTFEDGILTVTDYADDSAQLDLNEVLPTLRSKTEFVYNGIVREGYVIGLQTGRYAVNVEILETSNERDGEHDEPIYKLFTSDMISRARRDKSQD